MFGAGIALFYGVVTVGRSWFGPFTPTVEISRSLWALPAYAGYSLLRITIAYGLSLGFTLVYGYVAAYNARAERFMIPLLDVLQSIPVLSFLPGVMLAMVALFPGRQLGLELGAILLIFTSQVWNMAFSFYASLKSVPKEMREAALIYRFSWWQRFTQMELPFSAIGLVWNSMMSVAGGWFALMVCEMFVLGTRDFRLPGLGSYLQTAASAGDTASILWGIGTMILVIVLLDQFVWRPVIAWAEKFKVEQVESTEPPRSWVLNLVQHSSGLGRIREKTLRPLAERLLLHFARRQKEGHSHVPRSAWRGWCLRALVVFSLIGIGYGVVRVAIILSGLRTFRTARRSARAGCDFPASEPGSTDRRTVDDSCRRGDRVQSSAGAHRATVGSDCSVGACYGIVAGNPTSADSSRRRTWLGVHRRAVARHTVVRAVQRDRWCNGNSHRFEGMLWRVSHTRS